MASLINNHRLPASLSSSRVCGKRKERSPAEQNGVDGYRKWRSETQYRVYSTNLLRALRKLWTNRKQSPSSSISRRGRAVRIAANRALAVAGRGRTRWSRSILTSRSVKLRRRSSPTTTNQSSRSKERRMRCLRMNKKSLPAVEGKTKVLSRLVPGCRKQSLPVILDETTDYIVALEMQIRAMTAVAELLSSGGSSERSPSGG